MTLGTSQEVKAILGDNPSYFMDDYLPVDSVTWDDAQTFAEKLSALTGRTIRLLTEAEWEYAARGGSKSRVTRYSGSSTLDEVAGMMTLLTAAYRPAASTRLRLSASALASASSLSRSLLITRCPRY